MYSFQRRRRRQKLFVEECLRYQPISTREAEDFERAEARLIAEAQATDARTAAFLAFFGNEWRKYAAHRGPLR